MFINRSSRHRNSVIMSPASLSWWFKWEMGSGRMQQLCTHITFVINSVTGHQGVHWCELENADSGGEDPAHMRPSRPRGFGRWGVNERAVESRPTFLKKSEAACIWLQKCRREAKTKAGEGRRETNNKQKSLEDAESRSGMCWGRPGGLKLHHLERLIEVIWTCVLGFRVW